MVLRDVLRDPERSSPRLRGPPRLRVKNRGATMCARNRTREPANQRYRFPYAFENPFLVFVTVNDPSARAEILM